MMCGLEMSGVFGPFMAIFGLWMLLYADNAIKVFSSIRATPAAFYMGGLINLLIGLTILRYSSLWMPTAFALLSLFGWVMLARGVLVLYMPQLIMKWMTLKQKGMRFLGFVLLVWGLALAWLAFAM